MKSSTSVTGSTVKVIGGKYYNDLIDHRIGTLTASSAVLVDSNSAISDFIVGNNGTTGGAIKFKEGTSNGTHHVQLKAPNSLGANLELELITQTVVTDSSWQQTVLVHFHLHQFHLVHSHCLLIVVQMTHSQLDRY